MLHIHKPLEFPSVVAMREQDPATYVFHPLSGLRFFRRYVGGRWERWVLSPTGDSDESYSFWVRTGDAVHNPHLYPVHNCAVREVETWPKEQVQIH